MDVLVVECRLSTKGIPLVVGLDQCRVRKVDCNDSTAGGAFVDRGCGGE